jgi:hypothetical protein
MKPDKKTISSSYWSLPARNKFCSYFTGDIFLKTGQCLHNWLNKEKAKQYELMKGNWEISFFSPARKEEGGGFYYPPPRSC